MQSPVWSYPLFLGPTRDGADDRQRQRRVRVIARVRVVELHVCATQADVRAIRAAFPGTIWTKRYEQECGWWSYTGTSPAGHAVAIFACREAPPTCRAIVEMVEVEEQVPVKFETRLVTKERVRWECGDAKEDVA